jgi:hypothetical protein
MSTVSDLLQTGFKTLLDNTGQKISIYYYSGAYDSVYDTIGSLFVTRTTWTSGIVLPLNLREGSSEALMVQQGLLDSNDLRLFISGGVQLTGSETKIKIGLGSPKVAKYTMRTDGVKNPIVSNASIFKKVYLTKLEPGSFLGE